MGSIVLLREIKRKKTASRRRFTYVQVYLIPKLQNIAVGNSDNHLQLRGCGFKCCNYKRLWVQYKCCDYRLFVGSLLLLCKITVEAKKLTLNAKN